MSSIADAVRFSVCARKNHVFQLDVQLSRLSWRWPSTPTTSPTTATTSSAASASRRCQKEAAERSGSSATAAAEQKFQGESKEESFFAEKRRRRARVAQVIREAQRSDGGWRHVSSKQVSSSPSSSQNDSLRLGCPVAFCSLFL